jgi:hypothetical protein
MTTVHDITVRLSPIAAIALCSCGWTRTVTRRQNALARTSKLQAAMNAHWRDVAVSETVEDAP